MQDTGERRVPTFRRNAAQPPRFLLNPASHPARRPDTGRRVARLAWLCACLVCTPAVAAVPQLRVERIGPVVIEPANHYSENTRLRIRVVHPDGHPRAGEVMSGFRGPLVIEEWRTRIYDGEYGATRLPMTVHATGGQVEVVLKSLARYSVYDSRNAPVPQVAVFLGRQHVLVEVPQWVDENANEKTDWLEARVDSILRRARASGVREIVEVVSVLAGWKESYKRDCGGYLESEPRVASISSACIDWDGVNVHRLNMRQELTATVLHEARHVWAHYRPDRNLYKLRLLNAPSGRRGTPGCDPRRAGLEMCSAHISDERYAAQEADAEAFANRYKTLFP
jgi:hypothetical protein